MIDASDTGSLASSWVLLNELISHKDLIDNKPIVLVMNKTDLSDIHVRHMAMNILRINDLIDSRPGAINLFSGSCMELKLAESILKWMAVSLIV
jgi:GTPase SAR1 family protein